jgi:anti-anti-sigma factor
MELIKKISDNVPVLKVTGRVASPAAVEFIKEMKVIAAHDSPVIQLDLRETNFLDSASVGIICAVHIDRERAGKNLNILVDSSPDNFITNLFETTGLKMVLHIMRIEKNSDTTR